jgi:hypothetical protein
MPRRLLAAAVAGTLALAGLAGCREVPTVAAYVGDAQLTNKQVDQMAQEFNTDPNQTVGDNRSTVVRWFIIRELSRRIAQEHGITVAPVDASDVVADAKELNAKVGDAAQLVAEALAALDAIVPVSPPQVPTDADKREVFQILVDNHAAESSEFQPRQFDSTDLRAKLGLRAALREALHRYQLSVNPRYQPLALYLPVTVGAYRSLLPMSFEPGSPAVIDKG